MLTLSEEEGEDEGAVLAMWGATLLRGGGRRLGKTGGGILYEAASRYERTCWEQESGMPNDHGWMNAGCHLPKCSVEDERVKDRLATKDFVCEGTLYRHTRLSWGQVPIEYSDAHEVGASKAWPVKAFVYQHLIEDLMPFDRVVYWQTIWRKCVTCHSNDCRFKAWATSRKVGARCKATTDAARRGPKHRCLQLLRDRLGGKVFETVASYAPMSCMPALTGGELGCIDGLIRGSTQDHCRHWLEPYIDLPQGTRVKVSIQALAEAISPWATRQVRLDADGVYALLMLRNFDTSLASLEEDAAEYSSPAETDCCSYGGDELVSTPLCSAVGVNAKTIVRLLLDHRADPNGYQFRQFDWTDGTSWEEITPLFRAVMHCQPDLVDMLLQARADPEDWGYEKNLCGEAAHPDGGQHVDRITPLWQAMEDACDSNPKSQRGRDSRAIVWSLLLYGARPDRKGKIEYFSGFGADDSDGSLDSDGNANTSDSETTPLEAAKKRKAMAPGPEMPDPRWSADVVATLWSLMS